MKLTAGPNDLEVHLKSRGKKYVKKKALESETQSSYNRRGGRLSLLVMQIFIFFIKMLIYLFILFFFFSIERHCEDEQDMRKLVDEFHKDFTNTYERLREKARLIVKLKKSSQNVTKFPLLKKQIMTKQMNDYDEAKLW